MGCLVIHSTLSALAVNDHFRDATKMIRSSMTRGFAGLHCAVHGGFKVVLQGL